MWIFLTRLSSSIASRRSTPYWRERNCVRVCAGGQRIRRGRLHPACWCDVAWVFAKTRVYRPAGRVAWPRRSPPAPPSKTNKNNGNAANNPPPPT